MTNKEILKKKIIYRSTHRGSKEMDILLGSFVKKHIVDFKYIDIKNLNKILSLDDEIIHSWYFDKNKKISIPINRVSKMLKKFKI